MAKVTKHTRTSGATTIKRDGKIVGNIGKGKDNIPTTEKTSSPTIGQNETIVGSEHNSEDVYSPVHMMKQKFDKLEKQPAEETVSYDSGIMLWNLTSGKNMEERLEVLSNYIDDMTDVDQQKMFSYIKRYIIKEGRESMLRRFLQGVLGRMPDNVIDSFAQNMPAHDNYSLEWLLRNPEVSAETLDFFARKEDERISVIIAGHQNITPQTLDMIVISAQNFGISARKQIGDSVFWNPNVLPQTLDRLEAWNYSNISFRLLNNTKTPIETIKKLLSHKDSTIREKARARLKLTE